GAASCFVGGGEHAAAAKAGHGQAAGADEPCGALDAALLHNVPPRRDRGDAGTGAALDRLLERPGLDRRGIDGEPFAILGKVAHHASTPRTAMTARMRFGALSA